MGVPSRYRRVARAQEMQGAVEPMPLLRRSVSMGTARPERRTDRALAAGTDGPRRRGCFSFEDNSDGFGLKRPTAQADTNFNLFRPLSSR